MDSERVEELARNLRGVEKLVLELGDLVMTKKEEVRPPQKKARKESESSDEDDLSKLGEKLSLHVLHKHDPKLASAVRWSDVVGCKEAKQAFKEALVRPLRNPELYGPQMLSPAKTILLYGPPGTGKTSLCRIVAAKCNASFLSVTPTTFSSKWSGQEEKNVAALFQLARAHQPSIIFIDEMDSVFGERNKNDNSTAKKVKGAFLTEMEGFKPLKEEQVVVIAATNNPHHLDGAALGRFTETIFVPLPEAEDRLEIIHRQLVQVSHVLTHEEIIEVALMTKGYSGRDLNKLLHKAAKGVIRSLDRKKHDTATWADLRGLTFEDVDSAVSKFKLTEVDWEAEEWYHKYGSAVRPTIYAKMEPAGSFGEFVSGMICCCFHWMC